MHLFYFLAFLGAIVEVSVFHSFFQRIFPLKIILHFPYKLKDIYIFLFCFVFCFVFGGRRESVWFFGFFVSNFTSIRSCVCKTALASLLLLK